MGAPENKVGNVLKQPRSQEPLPPDPEAERGCSESCARSVAYCERNPSSPAALLKNHAIFDTNVKLCRNIHIPRLVIS